MLFDPRCKIDVVKLTNRGITKGTMSHYIGTLNESDLVYANVDASDYQVSSIKKYDIMKMCLLGKINMKKYLELINFNPIESIIQLTAANDKELRLSISLKAM